MAIKCNDSKDKRRHEKVASNDSSMEGIGIRSNNIDKKTEFVLACIFVYIN